MKISLEEVQEALETSKLEPTKVNEVIKKLAQLVEEKKEEKDETKLPRQKNEFLIVLDSSVTEDLKGRNDLTGWVVQIPTGQDAGLTLDKLQIAATDFNNNTRKGKKSPLKKWGDIFAYIARKFTKKVGVQIKTKHSVRVLVS